MQIFLKWQRVANFRPIRETVLILRKGRSKENNAFYKKKNKLYCKQLCNNITITEKSAPAKKKIIYEFSIKEYNNLQIKFVFVWFFAPQRMGSFHSALFACMNKALLT